MRTSVTTLIVAGILTCWDGSPTAAQDTQPDAQPEQRPGLTTDVQDPVVELQVIRQKREAPTYSLFRWSPLTPLRERGIAAEKRI